ncbi:MAG: DinB family protein [Bacteroidota bacterium]|nr:DinB family protein [Bacteroidota bacterium]
MKKIILSAFYLCFFSFVLSFYSNAQSLSSADIKEQMVKDWERAKAYTIDYLNTMPADKYSFKAADSLRSFAQQMLHLASGNVFLMMNAIGQPPLPWLPSDIEHSTTAQKKDSVIYYVIASYDYCINAVKDFDVNKWGEKTKMFNTYEESRFALMNKAFEHQGHHRGQTTIYIRLQAIKPPQERLF